MNYCTFQDFDINEYYLKFNVVVNFDGYDLISKRNYNLKDCVVPFHVEFSSPLTYDNTDVYKLVETYVACAKLKKKFQNIYINLDKEKGTQYYPINGNNYLLLNSGGFDATSIFYLLNDRLKERLISFTIIDKNDTDNIAYKLVNLNKYYVKPLFVKFIHQLNKIKLLSNPSNDRYLRFLAYKTYNIKLSLYGDTYLSTTYNKNYILTHKDIMNFSFYNSEFMSLYINIFRNSKNNYIKILYNNIAKHKIIRKIIETNIISQKKDLNYYVGSLKDFSQIEIEKYIKGHDSEAIFSKNWVFMMYNYIRQFYPDNEILQKFLNNPIADENYPDIFSINKQIFEMYKTNYGEEYNEIFQLIYEEFKKLNIDFK